MTTAIYAFSGDPITNGHINIIRRAAKTFDKVIVAIGVNPKKTYTFPLHERRYLAEKCFMNSAGMLHPHIRVEMFSNLLVDFAYEQGADVIIKGVRNAADFDYENVLDVVGKSQEVGIDTHVLFADPRFTHISSSAVKEIAAHNGNLSKYVPLHVKQALEEKIGGDGIGQKILGLTGEIGSGKSHISNILARRRFHPEGGDTYTHIHNIELDQIGHEILCELTEPAYVAVRKKIDDAMGAAWVIREKILDEKGFIKRDVLGSLVFNNKRWLRKLNEILEKPIMVRLRQKLVGLNGIILINCALLAEANMLHLCNNNVILVTVDKETQHKRLIDRGLSEKQIVTRLRCQYTQNDKRVEIRQAIDAHNHGNIWEIDNSNNISNDDIYKRFNEIIW